MVAKLTVFEKGGNYYARMVIHDHGQQEIDGNHVFTIEDDGPDGKGLRLVEKANQMLAERGLPKIPGL